MTKYITSSKSFKLFFCGEIVMHITNAIVRQQNSETFATEESFCRFLFKVLFEP